MDFRFTEKEEALRKDVREYLHGELELMADVRHETESGLGFGPRTKEFMRKIGAKGWLCPSWPEEYGGLGGSYMERYAVAEEIARFGGPPSPVGVSMAGPTILLFGNQEQKKTFLPKIARGEVEFALGYTEPEHGSDLASLQMRAVKDGDDYVINGQKVYNTACHYSEYHWLGTRTDPDVPKHRGISLFIVDLNSPGITMRPLIGMSGMKTNEVFYDDVRVLRSRLVGEENRGWYYIATALDFERTWVVGTTLSYFEEFLRYMRETEHNGQPLAKDPVIRQRIGELATRIEVVRLFGVQVACILNKGTIPSYEAAMAKVFGSEVEQELADVWMQALDLYGRLEVGSDGAPLNGRIGHWYLETIRGLLTRGTSEIMRSIIAMRGLGLPSK